MSQRPCDRARVLQANGIQVGPGGRQRRMIIVDSFGETAKRKGRLGCDQY